MTGQSEAPLLELLSRTRVFPESHATEEPRTVPLSIIDNTVIRFAMTNAGWYYDSSEDTADKLSPELLTLSLRKTLNAYPHWAGQLHWISHDSDHGPRQDRVGVTYGSTNDPGVELIQARCSATLSSLVPDTQTRIESGVWCADKFPTFRLLCPTQLAMHLPTDYLGKPCVCAQLTTFACGAVGIALRIAHCLSDATTLIRFAKHWGDVHRALVDSQFPGPQLTPLFNPRLIDQAAIGDVNSDAPDPNIVRISRSLPILKHDLSALEPASSLAKDTTTREAQAPGFVGHSLVYLTPVEVRRIYEDAVAHAPAGSRLSRFDAMLAFIWRLIVRARGMEGDPGPAHMVVTVGVRTRLSPPLPESFLGSPIILSRVTLPSGEIAASAAKGAVAIRSTVAQFTPETIGAFMHDVVHQADPQRYWRAFLRRPGAVFTCWRSLDVYALDFGSGARPPFIDAVMPSMGNPRYSVVTSWQDLDVYGVGFGGETPPRYVDAFIPDMDGCIHVTDAGPREKKTGVDAKATRWYDEMVCLSLHLIPEVMQKLLQDPELRKYRAEEA
ncbi:transferase [Trametes polyzona]|nr:transferase [Trametes polyzona]